MPDGYPAVYFFHCRRTCRELFTVSDFSHSKRWDRKNSQDLITTKNLNNADVLQHTYAGNEVK